MQQFEIMALDHDGACVSHQIVSAPETEAAQIEIARRHPDHAIVVRPLDQSNDPAPARSEAVGGVHPLAKRERVKAWDDFIPE